MSIIENGGEPKSLPFIVWKIPSGSPPSSIIRHEFQDEVARNISGYGYSSQAGSLAAVAISVLR
jgi:hypothetical protein